MYIYMPFSNLENKLVLSLFKFTYLIIYISLSKLKPKPHGRAILFFLPKRVLPSEIYDWVFVHQENDLFCMKNVNNMQEVWCSEDYSLILQAKFAERANEDTLSIHSITL